MTIVIADWILLLVPMLIGMCLGELIMELTENLFPGIGLPAEEDIEGIDDADI